jgi:Tetratricopeptide repeat
MREALSRSQRTKSKGKIRIAAKATSSKSVSRAKTKSSSSSRLKPAKKRLVKKTIKARSKTAKPVKKGGRIKRATAKVVKASAKKKIKRVVKSKKLTSRKKVKALSYSKPYSKSVSKSSVSKSKARGVPKVKRATGLHRASKVRSTGATRATRATRTARTPGATKVRTKGKGKVSLVVRAPKLPKLHPLPPLPPPEPPRRQVPSAVLRAFEQAVKVFNRRQYAEAKEMFENLQPRFPNEVEIIARAQTYIQVCNQKLVHRPSVPRNADELYDRGVFALNIGDFTQACTFFEKALRLRPDEPHLLYSLAATHAQTGSHDQAIDYLRRSIQIQPRFRSQALNDSDFSGLRENKQFLELLGLTSPFERLDSRR